MEMVQYWKSGESIAAKVTKSAGAIIMRMEGEKYNFPGFPRGHLLFGKLSKLKHELKNQVFNESWALLEKGKTAEDVVVYVRHEAMPNIYAHLDESRYDLIPPQSMVPAVREFYDAWTRVGGNPKIRDLITYILQEDDSYRFRFQWMTDYMYPRLMGIIDCRKLLEKGLVWLENAEVIGDMKERVRLVRRVLMTLLEDDDNRAFLNKFFREMQWRKIRLSKADKFYFRGKYFKVDLDKFDY